MFGGGAEERLNTVMGELQECTTVPRAPAAPYPP